VFGSLVRNVNGMDVRVRRGCGDFLPSELPAVLQLPCFIVWFCGEAVSCARGVQSPLSRYGLSFATQQNKPCHHLII
jgi:hypothetical protein